MRVAVPSEVKNHEYRVAITPVGVAELVAHGHEVYVQEGAGRGSAITDAEYVAQGATIVPTADETWAVGEMVLKVKEPVASEFGYLRDDLLLFTYLHLAADQADTDALLNAGTTAIAYETVQLPSGLLPLLYPMSEVAGCLAPQVGAHAMMKAQGGRGVLMGCVGGVAEREDRRPRWGCRRSERRQRRARHGGGRDHPRHRPGQAAHHLLALRQPGAAGSCRPG